MTDTMRENLNAVSGDSLRNNECIQTERSSMLAHNYEVLFEKRHSNEKAEGYSTKDDMTTAEGERERRGRKKPQVLTAQDAAGSSQPRQARKSSSRGVRPCKDVNPMAAIEPSSGIGNEERGKYKVLRKRVRITGDDSLPRQARKQGGQSSGTQHQKCENIGLDAAVQESVDVGNKGRGGYRALRIRAENAADVSRPRQAHKRRGQSAGSKRQRCKNINGVPLVQSSDTGTAEKGRYRALRIRAINA